MKYKDNSDTSPLPPEWLPEPLAPDGHPYWSVRAERLMVAANSELARLAGRRRADDFGWWSVLADWWRPSAAMATAAAAMLLLVAPAEPTPPPAGDALTLSIVAAEGSPVAIWKAFGVGVDPVLALLAFENHGSYMEPEEGAPEVGGGSR